MSDNNQLLNILKTLNYDNKEIHAIMDAAKRVETEKKLQASRDLSQMPTPMMAASQSAANARILRQTRTMIRHLSAQKYDLPEHEPVDMVKLNAAIRNASIEQRASVKSALHQLGLIR